MPKVSPLIRSFNAGEWSPRLDGRVDLGKYSSSCKVLQNFIPMSHGPAERRPGTKFIREVADSTKQTRLIPFEFSVEQAYILEFNDEIFRIYKDEGFVTATRSVSGAVDNGGGLIRITTSVAHDFATGTVVTITGVGGVPNANGTFTITFVSATEFDLQGSTFAGAYTTGGSVNFDGIETPFDHLELFEIKHAQSADILYFAHEDHAPLKLTRTSDVNWTLEEIDFQDGPYLIENTTATTLTFAAATGSAINVVASSVVGINDGQGFLSTDVGRLIRILDTAGPLWGWAEIVAFNSTTSVDVDIQETVPTGATIRWRLGLWSDTTGYPHAISFTEDRLAYGGGGVETQRINASVTGDYENFQPTQLDNTVFADNALSFTLLARDVNAIQWLEDDEQGLFCGTVGGEWIINSGTGSPMTPATIIAKRSTVTGCADIQAERVGKSVIFTQRSLRKLHELSFNFGVDGFLAPDVTILAEHITEGGTIEMAFQRQPNSVLWVVRNDGELLGFTFDKSNDVTAWHRHVFGGTSDAGGTKAKCESVAVIPSTDGSFSQVWVVVQRFIDGASVRHIETMQNMREIVDQEDFFYIDAGLTFDGAPTTTVSGLDHLEGEVVTILADGATHPDRTVSSGSITLQVSASVVQVGLFYESDLQINRIEAGAADGTAQGKTKRINKITIRVLETLGGFFGPDFDNLDPIFYRTSAMPMDAPPLIFSGDLGPFAFPSGYNKEAFISIRQTQPLPMTIIAIMPQLNTQDR